MEDEAFWENCIAEFRSYYENDPTNIPSFRNQIVEWQRRSGMTKAHLLDALARQLAFKFDEGKLEFDFCSTYMRNLQRASLGEWPELFWNTYIAFDAGETSHSGQSGDPVETHTRPMIKEVLGKQH